MAEVPKKRRSVIISRTIPARYRGPDVVAHDSPNIKFKEPAPEPVRVQLEPAKSLDRATREKIKREQAQVEAKKIKDEIEADEAMKSKRL